MLINAKNNIEEISKICDQVRTFCTENCISDDKYHDIVLILDEVSTNIINYAYPNNEKHEFIIDITKKDERIFIRITDSGAAFNPLSMPDPDVDSSVEARKIGGLGIFIVKQLAEIVEYSRIDNKNQLDVTVTIHN